MSFRVPHSWRVRSGRMRSDDSIGNNGAFVLRLHGAKQAFAIASDGEGWEHVSVSFPHRCPTWEEMCEVKRIFWSDEDCVRAIPSGAQRLRERAPVLPAPVAPDLATAADSGVVDGRAEGVRSAGRDEGRVMEEQSDTPRTDALMSALKGIVANDNERVSITIVGLKQLEQELSVVKRERDEARALNAELGKKAETWMASPEAAQRLQGYRELAQQVATAQNERDEARAEVERLLEAVKRAAIACSYGETQMAKARAILLAATEAKP